MKPSFNLLDRGWIPVVFPDGSIRELGIRETLEKAHELREISDPSPLEEYSLYRFLGLFLMDALRPKKISSIRGLHRKEKFDIEQIEEYIAQCYSEGVTFDLFDEKRPFLQSRFDTVEGAVKPVSKLDCTLPSGTKHTHFDHRKPETVKLSPAKGVRLLLASYVFCAAEGSGYFYNVYGRPPYFGVIKGDNLFETLISTLLPLDTLGIPFDTPPVFWRDPNSVVPGQRVGSVSWLQGMLFPARKIQLIPNEDNTVSKVLYCPGEKYENVDSWVDPNVTYYFDGSTRYALVPEKGEAIWRNMCDIVDIPHNHASRLLWIFNELGIKTEVNLTLYGAHTKKGQATFYSVRRYDFSFPLRLAESERIELLSKCIEAAHRMYRALRRALSDVGVIPSASVSTALGNYDKACEERFWAMCDRAGDPLVDVREQYSSFCNDVCDSVLMTFDQTLAAIRLRAHKLALAEEKRDRLFFEANKLKKEANS